MTKGESMKKFFLCTAAGLLLTGSAMAGEKKLMHCFAFTSQKDATPADWQAFAKATDELPKKIKSISHVWHGKLASPLGQRTQNGTIQRDYGVCMEMTNAAAREAYGKDPAHDEWT